LYQEGCDAVGRGGAECITIKRSGSGR